jgi:hypothetical protein
LNGEAALLRLPRRRHPRTSLENPYDHIDQQAASIHQQQAVTGDGGYGDADYSDSEKGGRMNVRIGMRVASARK